MKKKEMKKLRKIGDEYVTEEELRETMYSAARFSWCKIHSHVCDEKGCVFPKFVESVWVMADIDMDLSFALICMMLKESGEREFVADLESVCSVDEIARDSFVYGFNEGYEMYLNDECIICEYADEGEPHDDVNIKSPFDEQLFEINIKVSENYVQVFQKQLADTFKSLGIPIPYFESGAEEDE